jgi:hypothetical protein
MDWQKIEVLKGMSKVYYDSQAISKKGKGLPIIIVQTSKSKAEFLIEKLKEENGVKGFAFNPLQNPFTDEEYDLGIIQTNKGSLHLLSEFDQDDDGLEDWWKLCHKCNNSMAIIVAMGVTGASKGHPQLKHILGVFETKGISSKDLGMGLLQLMPSNLEFEDS